MREQVPSQFSIGESLSWRKCFALYPALDGWTLTYSFRGAGKGFDASAEVDESGFILSVASSVTAEMSAGRYYFQAFAEKGNEKILVDSGEVSVMPGFATIDADTVFDGRSQVKKILDAVDALIEGKASRDQMEYSIGNRHLKRYALIELLSLRDKYQRLYNEELIRAKGKSGGGPFKNVYVRFRNPR